MTTLFSLMVVYLLKKYLLNYIFFKNLQYSCTAHWLEDLLDKVQIFANKFPKVPGMAITSALILAVAVIVLLVRIIFYYISASLGEFLLNILLLFYCMCTAEKRSYSSVFVATFEHTFGLLFWFTLLGPVGLVLFWLLNLGGAEYGENPAIELDHCEQRGGCAVHHTHNYNDNGVPIPGGGDPGLYGKKLRNCLFTLHTLAAWLPARIVGLVFSLIGDFKQGFSCWKNVMRNLSTSYIEVLDLCGEAALSHAHDDQPELLVERAVVAWLLICIMLGLII